MARYEFYLQDGRADKFWTVETGGNTLTVQFGRAGTSGQTQIKSFASEAEAERVCAKLIAEKRGKGYRDGRADQPAPTAPTGKALDLAQVTVCGGPLALTTNGEIDALEATLGVTLPRGYREYLTTLGEGVLGGCFVRVYPPRRVSGELEEWRERIRAYWFWDAGRAVLSKQRALESVLIADTVGGDELVFHPQEPGRLLALPAESGKIFVAGSGLLEAVEWLCDSGKLARRFRERVFEPFDTAKS